MVKAMTERLPDAQTVRSEEVKIILGEARNGTASERLTSYLYIKA